MSTPIDRESLVSLVITEGSQRAAARKLGISDQQASKWMREPDTLDLIRTARRDLLSGVLAETRKHLTSSINVLAEISKDPHQVASARVAAASKLLDTADRLSEQLEVSIRIEAIESKLEERTISTHRQGGRVIQQ